MNKRAYAKMIGNAGEMLVQSSLRSRGFLLPERIATPVKISPPKNPRLAAIKPRVFHVAWSDPVSGDHRAYFPGGHGVLVESKTYLGKDRLRYSALRGGQPERLHAHAEIGVSVFLAWVSDLGVILMRWPIPGFVHRTSLMLDSAWSYNIPDVKFCRELGGDM